ncbi:hypothetical protein [Desulfonatronum parangueonense]
MAEYGEWVRKGAVLSDVTAEKEYKISRDFIHQGINLGKLEFREASIWGNPFIKILRSQLEAYIAEEFGKEYLVEVKGKAELRTIKKDINTLKKKLKELEGRKAELEALLK